MRALLLVVFCHASGDTHDCSRARGMSPMHLIGVTGDLTYSQGQDLVKITSGKGTMEHESRVSIDSKGPPSVSLQRPRPPKSGAPARIAYYHIPSISTLEQARPKRSRTSATDESLAKNELMLTVSKSSPVTLLGAH